MDFYRVEHAADFGSGWHPSAPYTLVDGKRVDPRVFTDCEPYDGPPLRLETVVNSPRRDITLGPFNMPVLTKGAASVFNSTDSGQIQLIPIETDEGAAPAFILNALNLVDCLDEHHIIGDKWSEGDGRPEKVGQYRMIVHLYIDPSCVGACHVFRVKGWMSPLIISAELASGLRSRGHLIGVELVPVVFGAA